MFKKFAYRLVCPSFGMEQGSRLADAVNFFIYDIIRIFLPLSVVIFVISFVGSHSPPERTRRILSHKLEFIGADQCRGISV